MNTLIPLLIPVAKYLAASAALYLLYHLFLRKNASYRESRVFLLNITLLAIPLSQFRIEITHPAPVYVAVSSKTPDAAPITGRPVASPQTTTGTTNKQVALTTGVPGNPTTVAAHSQPDFLHQASSYISSHTVSLLLALYLLVSLTFALNLLIQYLRIRRLRHNGQTEKRSGYTLVRHNGIDTPFSSGKTVFLPLNLSENQEEIVHNHERWHIRHRHYIDVLIQEIQTCLFWFNPSQWLVRKELRSIHEYETDHSVLEEGTDLYRYQTIILEEVMGKHFRLANGFNQSFTKKRFIQMKNTNFKKLPLSRKLLLAPALTLLFAALCFVPGKSQVIEYKKDTQIVNSVPVTTTQSTTFKIDTVKLLNITPEEAQQPGHLQTAYLKSLDSLQQMVSAVLPVARKLAASPNPTADTKSINALLNAMNVSSNGQGISYSDLSKEFTNSLTRKDFTQFKSILDQMNDSLRLYRTFKVDRLNSPYTLRPLTIVQQLMSSDLISKLLPELFNIMSNQLNGMMEGMSNGLSGGMNNNENKTGSDKTEEGNIGETMAKAMGTMLNLMTKATESMDKAIETVNDKESNSH